MPTYTWACKDSACEWGGEGYVARFDSPDPPCGKCGSPTERVWGGFGAKRAYGAYPYTTRNILPDGKPITVTDPGHEAALCKQFGLVKRDDAGWIEKVYEGYDMKTGKQKYKESSGVGMPNCWF